MRFICAVLCAILVNGCSRIIEARYPLTPLAKAARTGDIGEIDRLIAAGADVNAGSGVNAWPPLMHAVHKGQISAVARLLERGASVDGDVGREALVMASGYGDAKKCGAAAPARRRSARRRAGRRAGDDSRRRRRMGHRLSLERLRQAHRRRALPAAARCRIAARQRSRRRCGAPLRGGQGLHGAGTNARTMITPAEPALTMGLGYFTIVAGDPTGSRTNCQGCSERAGSGRRGSGIRARPSAGSMAAPRQRASRLDHSMRPGKHRAIRPQPDFRPAPGELSR